MILKLKQTPGIFLVGFMAAGKTTVGRMLAARIGWHFADLDEDIESREKISIADLFDSRGEAEFRRLETEAMRTRIRKIECGFPTVIALGGGAFVQPDNFSLLENNGVSLWLDCPLDLIRQRVGNSDRPMARDPVAFERLYHDRRSTYALAD